MCVDDKEIYTSVCLKLRDRIMTTAFKMWWKKNFEKNWHIAIIVQ
jgi:hypothetical protein